MLPRVTLKFNYFISPFDSDCWVGYCELLNIYIYGDTLEEVTSDFPAVIQDVLDSMTDEELEAYNVPKIDKNSYT